MGKLENTPVLHINTAGTWRGGEKQTFYLTRELHKKGFKSYCVCRKNSHLHKMLSDESLPHFPLIFGPEFNIPAAFKILRIAGQINAGIVHMHTAHAHTFGMLMNLLKPRISIVSRRVDFRIRKNLFSKRKYKFPDRYIAVSGAIREILIEDGIPPERISVVHSGIHADEFKNIQSDYLFREFGYVRDIKNRIRIANVAALTHQKDHSTLLNALKILNREFKNIILFIAGEGELLNDLMKQCRKLSLEDYVIFTGFREDALNLIDFADIFVMSSRWEGLGTSIIDAMALKKPVVATATGGIPELITNNMNGILVPKEDPEALAEAVYSLIRDEKMREKISGNASSTAENFNIEQTVQKTINVYRELLELNE